MSVELAASAFSKALGLTDRQVKLLLRTGWVLAVTTWMVWCCGGLTTIGLAGPAAGAEVQALKSDVKSLNSDVTGIKVQLLEQTLFDVRLRQCKAETPESRQYYYERLQEKMNLYYAITQRNWLPPDCKEIS